MNSAGSNSINEKTKISVLIKANPLVIDALVKFNPHFSKLKNPILRNLLAPRVNISEACKIGGCQLNEFLDKMSEIGFEVNRTISSTGTEAIALQEVNKLAFPENMEVIELDVRPILAQKQDPLNLIIKNTNTLKEGQCLKIINTFEPFPLINLLAKKGFQYRTERPDAETVITFFIKTGKVQTVIETMQNDSISNNDAEFERMILLFEPDKLHKIDVREMEMPLPMIAILEHLKKLKSDEALFVYHKKVPVFLLPELEERGFSYLIQNGADNKVDMLIYKS